MALKPDTTSHTSSRVATAKLRKDKRDNAAKHLSDTIEALDALLSTYVPAIDGPFSACHPRTGITSTKGLLEKLLKSLINAKV